MMKTSYLILPILILLCLTSCASSSDIETQSNSNTDLTPLKEQVIAFHESNDQTTAISLDSIALTIDHPITITFIEEDATYRISSKDTSIVTVAANNHHCTLTPIAIGTSTLRIEMVREDYETATLSIPIIVREAPIESIVPSVPDDLVLPEVPHIEDVPTTEDEELAEDKELPNLEDVPNLEDAPQVEEVPQVDISTYADQVVALVNERRSHADLPALIVSSNLSAAAAIRAREIVTTFSHTRPNGTNFNTVSSEAFGENIAYGLTTPDAVMASWMDSPGHKANILLRSYTTIGVGVYEVDGRFYWVQLFG